MRKQNLINTQKMLKTLYNRYQYFFNMLAVLVLVITQNA